MVKAKGSWVTLDTPAQKIRVLATPSLPPPRSFCWSPGGKICMHSRIFFFLCEQTFLTACHSRLDNTSYSMRNYLSLYILHVKYIEDITRWREDMNFMFEWQEEYLTSERSERIRCNVM